MPTVVVIPQGILEAFIKPALDLQTGQIIELSPPVELGPLQLELQFAAKDGE